MKKFSFRNCVKLRVCLKSRAESGRRFRCSGVERFALKTVWKLFRATESSVADSKLSNNKTLSSSLLRIC